MDSNQNEDLESILLADPAGAYARMDAPSRADYHAAVAALSARSARQPAEVARLALDLAVRSASVNAPGRARHVGCHLVAEGRRELLLSLGVSPSPVERLNCGCSDRAAQCYVWSVASLTLLIALSMLSVLPLLDYPPWAALVFWLDAALLASFVAMSWLGNVLGSWFPPRRLPRLEFPAGIPEEFRTLVVVPCILTSGEDTARLARSLERHFLGNRDPNLGFCLLTDFADATEERLPADEELLHCAEREIDDLNQRHGGGFVLLHRARRWNPSEACWMGWERKRGKLEELNCLLTDAADARRFAALRGDLARLRAVAFVITLDDDNVLPAGQAVKLIAILAHPLQRPLFDESGTSLVAGYGILAPRRCLRDPQRAPTRFERWSLGVGAEEPPDGQLVPNLYQDLIQQANYNGKGIYDVVAFHRISFGHVPENRVLSHDVLECAMVRTAAVSDVVLPEKWGTTYEANRQRMRRWLRGEWQLAPWLFAPRRMTHGGRLSAFGRWFIFDNMRRMLLPIAAVSFLVVGWLASSRPGFASLALLGFPLLMLIPSLLGLAARGQLTFAVFSGVLARFARIMSLNYALSVFECQTVLEAVFSASTRLLISRRRLLEWTASALVDARGERTLVQHYAMMWTSPLLAIVLLASIPAVNPGALPWALPYLASWLAAPAIAWWMNRPVAGEPVVSNPVKPMTAPRG